MTETEQAYWSAHIYDVLSGNASEQKVEELQQWRKQSVAHAEFYQKTVTLYTTMDFVPSSETDTITEAAYQAFVTRTKANRSIRLRRILPYIGAAASLIVCFLLGLMVARQKADGIAAFPSTITVAKGSKTQTTLPDGTTVWLNAESTLHIQPDFGLDERRVAITGEAFFDVAKDATHPFIVETATVKVKVLGTSFHVANRPSRHEVRVALVEGAVDILSSRGKRLRMKPDQTVVYDIESGQFIRTEAATAYEYGWRDAKFIFKNKKFADITDELERLFDVEIKVNNPKLATRKFTGDFENNESLVDILDVIAELGQFQYAIRGRIITIK
ncbi:FecR domain-containing protein [Sphingobacterium sp. lm-10]|uniref:FecR family protein n=1 Tax=Sphingobacterium sp. lm-10 TaxID=2944904 RepID=UPI00202146F7|nr:FecR domain-containing protein [Sphingobacterium sp. lm-10]MCL7988667.1 FecR domain-containing protein [Sphingobacterium sp. lm-10]